MMYLSKRIKVIAVAWIAAAITILLPFSVIYGDRSDDLIFTWGSYGQTVKAVQDKMKRWGYYNGNIDGIYNYRTMEAVRQYQRNNGITDSGNVTVATLEALGVYEPDMKQNSSIDSFENDVWLLASLIEKEAKGEDYITKLSLAAMILNRVQHPEFAGDIAGVIYEPGAFQSVLRGELGENPTEDSLEAARDAMHGWDPVNGAVYYWKTGSYFTVPATKVSGSYSFGIQDR